MTDKDALAHMLTISLQLRVNLRSAHRGDLSEGSVRAKSDACSIFGLCIVLLSAAQSCHHNATSE